MSLASLKSAYSYYDKRDAGFLSSKDTKFVSNKNDLTISVDPRGFSDEGRQETFAKRISANSFNLRDQGTSRRIQQLGTGTKFPIGPKGQVHEFDKFRGGFSEYNKYSDTYNSLSTAGLADTYTKDSPIDDMYNIVKVRDVASRRDILRQPFILRGIQRNENSDPQRFGPTLTADLPRGGVLTATNRAALDVARITKFLATPEGLLFNTKQFGQQLMNPNVEGINGKPGKIINPNSTKLYTPVNLLANIAGDYLGLRSRRHGLLPGNLSGGPSNDFAPGKYEDVINARSDDNKINHNRLIRIHNELGTGYNPVTFEATDDERAGKYSKLNSLTEKLQGRAPKVAKFIQNRLFPKGVINTLSGLTGPKSAGGIGVTNITTTSITTSVPEIDKTIGHLPKATVGKTADFRKEETARLKNSALSESLDLDGFNGAGFGTSKSTDTAKEAKNQSEDKIKIADFKTTAEEDIYEKPLPNIRNYKTLAYGNIPKRENRKDILDFRTGKEYDPSLVPLAFLKGAKEDKKIDNYNSFQNTEDSIIPLKLTGRNLNVSFKAYITSLEESIDIETPIDTIGGTQISISTGEKKATKQINLSFIVAANSPKELNNNYKKITQLQKYAANSISAAETETGEDNIYTTLTLGDLYRKLGGLVLNSISISWDTEYPFEITPGMQVPLVSEISLGFEIPILSESGNILARYTFTGKEMT